MNKKGQALVEFVIILPIIVFILFATIDMGKIFYTKSTLENKLNDVITMYQNDEDINTINNTLKREERNSKLDVKKRENKIEFSLSKKIEIITPGLNLIFKNPYEVSVKRVIHNENK